MEIKNLAMKKSILIIITFSLYLNCHAQTDKASFQIGLGGLPIIYFNGSSPAGYSLRANFGYFPINKLAVGLVPYIGKVDYMKSVGVNLYTRYYFLNKKIALFIEANAGFGNLKYETNTQYNGIMSAMSIGPGIHYIFKNKIAIELILQYARLRNISYPEDTMIGNTFIPTVGIQYFIYKKK